MFKKKRNTVFVLIDKPESLQDQKEVNNHLDAVKLW